MPEPSLPAEPRTLGRGSMRVAMTGRSSGVGFEVLHRVAADIVPAPGGPAGFDARRHAPPRVLLPPRLSFTCLMRAERPPPERVRAPRACAPAASAPHAPTLPIR